MQTKPPTPSTPSLRWPQNVECRITGKAAECPKVEQLSLAVQLGEAIRRIHEGASVSSLFV